jgi:hypothetical protein
VKEEKTQRNNQYPLNKRSLRLTQGGRQMIEATEIRAQSDIFDFLRIINDEVLGLTRPDEIGSGANFSLHSINQLDSVIQSETEIEKKA